MNDILLEWRQVWFSYGDDTVLRDISLGIKRGQFVGIVGPSGAGKTTLLKTITGAIVPTRGYIRGEANAGKRLTIGYVPQLEMIDWNFPILVHEVVLLGRIRQSPASPFFSDDDQVRTQELLKTLGIAHLSHRHISSLSGGERQRVFLARALISTPDILVLDEPTAGTDVKTRDDILHLLAHLNRRGHTIVITTHDLNSVAAHLPWVVCFHKTILAQGTPDEVFTDEILSKTFGAELTVLRQNGHLTVLEKPHEHKWRDLREKQNVK